ncbi:MAG: MarR family transcriptional regulator [Ruminococcaceae bacterium]|nr:MarR family transcriptional regulator [Oscillospiraceae bacterium]
MNRYFNANAVLSVFCKKYMDLKKGLPIRPSEMGVLNIITKTEGPHSPAVLAEMLGVSKPMITAHIVSLEKKGYITKSPSAHDKRAYHVLPTEKARALVENAGKELNAQLEYLSDSMGRKEFDKLVDLAAKANNILKSREE